jgi:protein TonB
MWNSTAWKVTKMPITESCVSTDPQHYVWWFPGSPVKVHLDLRIVTRLQERIRQNGHGAIEEEGLLFGRALDGVTEILEFQPAVGRSVSDMVAALPLEQGRHRLVGYYRTEQGQTFALNENDLALAGTLFGKSHQVFMLIQPNSFGSPSATFFFHDGNHKMADVSFMEFPLDASLLAIEERDRIKRSQLATVEPSIGVSRPLPSVPAGDGGLRRTPRNLLKAAKWPAFAVVLFAAGVLIGSHPFRERASRAWHAIVSGSAPPSSTQPAAAPSMGLRATRQNGDLQLSWNRESAVIANATSGLISIQDGNAARQILLDLTQLRGGSLLYSPIADQILMQLTVITPAATVTESVMVLVPKSGAAQTYPVQISRSAAESAVRPQPPLETLPAQTRPLKPFTIPSIKRAAPAPVIPSLNEPPSLRTNQDLAPHMALALPQAPVPPPPISTSPAQRTPVQELAASDPPSRPASASGAYQPPIAITKIMPKYPVPLRSLAVKPRMIEVRVSIDKDGHVTKAEPVTHNGVSNFFLEPAVYAARLWRFQPARRGEQPVESESVLQFVFNQ